MAIVIRDTSRLMNLSGSKLEWMLALWLDEKRKRDFAIVRIYNDDGSFGYGNYCEKMAPPFFAGTTFAAYLRQLFAGVSDLRESEPFREPFTDGEIREVLLHLGGESAVSSYECGVPLDDIFAGW